MGHFPKWLQLGTGMSQRTQSSRAHCCPLQVTWESAAGGGGLGRARSSHSNAQAAFPGRQARDREEGRDRRGTGRTQEEEADEDGG